MIFLYSIYIEGSVTRENVRSFVMEMFGYVYNIWKCYGNVWKWSTSRYICIIVYRHVLYDRVTKKKGKKD